MSDWEREWRLRHELLGWRVWGILGPLAAFLLGWVACYEGWFR